MSFRKGLPGTDKLYLIAFKCHVPRNSEESEEHRSLNRERKNYPIAEYLQNAHGPGRYGGSPSSSQETEPCRGSGRGGDHRKGCSYQLHKELGSNRTGNLMPRVEAKRSHH